MLDDIMFSFDKNFGRVNNLLKLYIVLTSGKKGARPVEHLDLLRAIVVMLHSTLEDFIRNLLNWKLPHSDKEKLNKIPLYSLSDGRKAKFELGELIEHKGKLIEDVIEMSVKEYLNTVSFNSSSEIISRLKDIKIQVTIDLEGHLNSLEMMIKRRHNIVHQADRNFFVGGINHRIKPIDLKTVQKWQMTVDKFTLEILKQLKK